MEPLPEQDFTWQILPGSKFNDFDPGKIDVPAAVVDGEFAGRRKFMSYPDPQKMDWSPRILKRLIESLGVEMLEEEGSNPIAYLNRVAGNRFGAPIKHRKYTSDAGVEVTKDDINIFNVHAAA